LLLTVNKRASPCAHFAAQTPKELSGIMMQYLMNRSKVRMSDKE
jgi:hypothetical protein